MSLLNDMLRDLSQGRPAADGGEAYDNALLQSSSFEQKKKQSWMALAVAFFTIFAMVFAINMVLHKFSFVSNMQALKSESKNSTNEKNIPIVANVVVAENTTAKMQEDSLVVTKDNAEKLNPELQLHIQDLLQQAERAIGMERLTAPVEDNAYGYYQKILSMDASNNDAKDGLDNIANRLLIKAQEQIQLGNSAQADALVQRARFVSARYVDAHAITLEASNQIVAAPVTQHLTVSQASTPTNQTTSETIKPFDVAEAPSISVSPNAGWKDEQMARHAQGLLEKGQQAEALTLLKNFVATEKSPALSVALLADVYIQQSNTAAATIIVEHADYLPADVKAKLTAQILSANGDDTKAISVLEKNLTTADDNESYRALLASLYHKTANYQQSVISYQRLNNSFGEKPAYWLGMALAFDGLSQPKSALQAYQRLREFPQLQAQVKQYTDQRIAALRSQ